MVKQDIIEFYKIALKYGFLVSKEIFVNQGFTITEEKE
jgi:hypothetical protein